VILGDPGFGKTWLLRYEARRLALQAALALEQRTPRLEELILPIFLRLSDLARCAGGIEEGLAAVVGEHFTVQFRDWVKEKVETEHCVILLDAWDEVPVEPTKEGHVVEEPGYRQYLGRRLESFARRFPRPRVLMTSRLVGYTDSPIPGAIELEMLAWETGQQKAFVEVWFGEEEKTNGREFLGVLAQKHDVRGLGRIPLMLALMCRAYQAGGLNAGLNCTRVVCEDCCVTGSWENSDQKSETPILVTLT
jgi:predicted NACHT family NTPase